MLTCVVDSSILSSLCGLKWINENFYNPSRSNVREDFCRSHWKEENSLYNIIIVQKQLKQRVNFFIVDIYFAVVYISVFEQTRSPHFYGQDLRFRTTQYAARKLYSSLYSFAKHVKNPACISQQSLYCPTQDHADMHTNTQPFICNRMDKKQPLCLHSVTYC